MNPAPFYALDAIGSLPDEEIDLAAAALQLARAETPEADWRRAETHLSQLARAVTQVSVGLEDLPAQGMALRRLLAGRYGYTGDEDTYDDPANANLIRVIERRRGLPVALGILWMHAAHAAGWRAIGLNVPGHFLVGLQAKPDLLLVVDPFSGGDPVDTSHLPAARLAPMRRREVLLRLQNNIRLRRAQSGDLAGAIRAAEDMLRIAPNAIGTRLETADLHEQAHDLEAALRLYGEVAAMAPETEAAAAAEAAMRRLRAGLH